MSNCQPKKELAVGRLGTEPPSCHPKGEFGEGGDREMPFGEVDCRWGLYQTAIPPDPSGWQITRKMVPEFREFEQRRKTGGLSLHWLHTAYS
jgi:hypothetical protein